MSEKEIRDIICKKLNYYMQLNGTTQTELAEYMEVSTATVSNWCKGVKTPRMSKIDKICNLTIYDPSYGEIKMYENIYYDNSVMKYKFSNTLYFILCWQIYLQE